MNRTIVTLAWLVGTFALGWWAYWLPLRGDYSFCWRGTYTFVAQAAVVFFVGVSWSVLSERYPSLASPRVGPQMPGLHPTAGIDPWVGVLAAWSSNIELSLREPLVYSCSHQLLPFEAALWLFAVVVAARVGALMGKRLVPFVRQPLFWQSLAMATLLTFMTPLLLPVELRVAERRAFKDALALGREQMAYRARHPHNAFACHFSELGVHGAVSEGRPAGEAYYTGGYSHQLTCYKDDSERVVNFAVWLTPYCVQTCGDVQYCVSGDGVVRALERSSATGGWGDCWTEGRAVASVSR